ncbi:porin [Thiomicrorhabdus lithotrophica]|uniref:Porin n=1 Tax=Thiomicrorhabdus lithotrophica TaxID=2949997 RepID=A0ABY8CCX9_9GAMM|nr:porin [Thiomicrorhabdus lithotrophica]WEJ62263.1 porin [Thiomicrorhabdus lithotrophica]
MKKNIIALAVASAISAPVAMADAPVVYGIANMAINTVEDAGSSTDSIASRLGVKGSEDLGNGLKAVYKMEFGLDLAGSNGVTARNQYVGLAGGFGTFLMGTHDTPLKMSQPKDLFNDGKFDNSKTAGGVLVSGGEVRADNVIAYVSPSFSGVKLVAAAVSGTVDPDAAPIAPDTLGREDSELADAYSVAVMYGSAKKGLYLAAAYNGGDQFDNAEETRISAQYKTGGLTANAMWQDEDNTGTNVTASAGYKIGKMMPKIKYSTTDLDNSTASPSTVAIGLNYSLGKKTTAYIEYGTFDTDTAGDSTTTVSSIGLQHKF